jgi:hypothetical protein
MSILDFLKPGKTVLLDDATTTDESKMKLRVFLPIASEVPRTWYSEDSFRPLEFDKMRGVNQTVLLGQNKQDYQEAVAKVRATSLKILSQNDTQLSQWNKTYLQNDVESNVHQLAHKMYHILTGRIMGKQAEAKRGFADFYKKYLVSTSEQIAHLPEYKKALQTLENYMIWTRVPH